MHSTISDLTSFANAAIADQQERMFKTESKFYTDDDRARFRSQVWCIRQLQPTLEALPDLLAALHRAFPALNQKAMKCERINDTERAEELTAIADQLYRALEKAHQLPADFMYE